MTNVTQTISKMRKAPVVTLVARKTAKLAEKQLPTALNVNLDSSKELTQIPVYYPAYQDVVNVISKLMYVLNVVLQLKL